MIRSDSSQKYIPSRLPKSPYKPTTGANPSSELPVNSVFGDGGTSIHYEDGEGCSLSHDRTTNSEKFALSPQPKPSPPLIIANPDLLESLTCT